jgi:hypothetical protein
MKPRTKKVFTIIGIAYLALWGGMLFNALNSDDTTTPPIETATAAAETKAQQGAEAAAREAWIAKLKRPDAHFFCSLMNWSQMECQQIDEQQIWIGMDTDQVRASRGKPKRINRSLGSYGVRDQWIYGDESVYVENGKVVAYQPSGSQ